MSLFKKLFGKKQTVSTSHTKQESPTPSKKESNSSINPGVQEELKKMMNQMQGPKKSVEQFEFELLNDSFARYHSNPGYRTEIEIQNEKGEVVPLHVALHEYYQEWQGISSFWDRMSLLYKYWDTQYYEKLEKWQIVERLVKDRYAMKAIKFHESSITQEDFQDMRLVVALSKLYRAMDSYENALNYAKGAYELRPDLAIVKTEYATVLHLSKNPEDQELAHKMIQEVLETKINEHIKDSDEKEIPLLNWFLFSNNYMDSSIFAAVYLQIGECDLDTWSTIANDYYWCPVFRYQHSVALSDAGEGMKAIAKLTSLSDEFPWYKPGVLACIDGINQIRNQLKSADMMEDAMKRMEHYKSVWKK